MSTSTRPGSCRDRGLRRPTSASPNSAVSVVRSATSASSRDPACDTTPSPSAVAVTSGRVLVASTSKVLLCLDDLSPQQAQSIKTRTRRSPHEEPGLGNTPTTSVRRFTSLVELLERVRAPDLFPVRGRERGERQQVLGGVAQHGLDLGRLATEH